jgi:hypothetical protein
MILSLRARFGKTGHSKQLSNKFYFAKLLHQYPASHTNLVCGNAYSSKYSDSADTISGSLEVSCSCSRASGRFEEICSCTILPPNSQSTRRPGSSHTSVLAFKGRDAPCEGQWTRIALAPVHCNDRSESQRNSMIGCSGRH